MHARLKFLLADWGPVKFRQVLEDEYLGYKLGDPYEVLGVRAQIGREIRPSDDMPGSPAVAMISDAFWTRRFARDPSVLGKNIQVGTEWVTIDRCAASIAVQAGAAAASASTTITMMVMAAECEEPLVADRS